MSSETLTTISPSTNQPIVTRKAATPQEIAKLSSIAQKAFAAYRKSCPTLSSRQKIVTKALQLLSEKQDDLAKELTEQMGRPIAYTAKEITTAVKRGEYLNSIVNEVLGQDVPGKQEAGFRRFIRREPVGVVLVLFAWNVRPGRC
jgi:acyl-CoA reductase-like NAD-dependent aldehyde dehydrogenase